MSHESASDMEIAFSRGVLRFRWAVMALALGVVSVLALGATKLSITNSYRVFFNPDNPDLLAFDSAQRMFSHNDNVMFVVVPANDNVFTRSNLQAIKTVTERAWHLPYASRVDSVTNFQHTEASGDELTVRDLVGKPEALSPDELQKIRRTALSEPVLAGNLVAVDGRAAAVNAFVLLPGKDEHHEIPEVVSAARKLAAQVEHEFPEVKVRLTGVLMMDNAFAEASLHDAQTLVALSFTLMLVMTAVLMGGPVAGIGTALVVGLAIAAAMGVAGYLGYQVSPPMAAAPVIILTVAIANCVHILQSFLERWSAGGEREEAIVYAVSTNLTPIFLASLTTVIGFLTFNFSDVPPFRQLGNIVAFGDIASYLLAVTLLPAVLAVAPLRRPPPRPLRVNAFKRLCEFVLARRRALLVGMALVIVALLAAIPRNRLNDVFLHYFDETIAFRADSDYTIAHLTGLYHVQFTLRASEAGGVSEPAFLRDVQSFTGWLRSQPEVVHVNSFVDTMKRLNRNMHGDDTEYYRLPESRELAAQYLLLYEMSLPYGLDLNNQINVDKSALRINLALRTLSSSQFIDFKKRAERWAQRHTPAIVSADGSGTIMMFSQIGQKNIRSMLTGTVVALVLISCVLLLMLRSVKLGLISLAPNLLPPALGFGLWGIISGEITLSLSVVTSMTLGIIIDDTVHFLVRYQRARKAGANPEMAVRETYSEVAPAMFFTSIILITGFLVLALSHFELNAGMGLLTAIVIGFALVLDLLLLSPLLLLIEEKSDASAAAAPDHAAASQLALAATPEEAGLAIATEARTRDRGWGDLTVAMTMTLRNAAGEESGRELRVKMLEVEGDGDKSLSLFDLPRDIAGTAFLSYTHALVPDDQWLYLPALKRVKRISSANKSGPFMGSEFAYEDLTSSEIEKYRYSLLREEALAGKDCFVIEEHPVYENSGYTRRIVWLDKALYQPLKVEFYDRNNALLKTLTASDYQQYQGKYWRAARMQMVNHQSGKQTDLIWRDYRFGRGLTDRDFDQNAIKR